MHAFYEVIQNLNKNNVNVILTVTQGAHAGEKAVISEERLIWETKEAGFFSENLNLLKSVENSGMLQVGEEKIYCELAGSQKKMVICGGGHVSMPIIKMALMIGFHVTVLEDRPKFADHARRAGATCVICEPFAEGLSKVEGDANTFFVIVTRGHRYDLVCLESIIRKKHAYIGMIGSKRRVMKVKEAIVAQGVEKELVESVYTPIGLNIGAETPEEIAVSIMAEIIEVKNKRNQIGGYSKEILKAIEDENPFSNRKVLATIIERKGSAPRGVGSKMVICADGTCAGTIGGGCMEADIFQKARMMMLDENSPFQICHVDLNGQDAEEDGMVCGGVIDVMLEKI